MLRNYNPYELKALKQLSEYRKIFSGEVPIQKSKKTSSKNTDSELGKKIEKFTGLFCENNFADADYSIIQKDQYSFESIDAWINTMNIDIILQAITYIIWTDRSNKGYFVKKINDKFLHKILTRLHVIVEEFNAGMPVDIIAQETLKAEDTTISANKAMDKKGFLAFFF